VASAGSAAGRGSTVPRILSAWGTLRKNAGKRRTPDDAAVTYGTADLEALSLPDARFDVVNTSLAFHHVEDAARLKRWAVDAISSKAAAKPTGWPRRREI